MICTIKEISLVNQRKVKIVQFHSRSTGYPAFTRRFGWFSTIVKDNEKEMKMDTSISKQILSRY